MKSQQSEGKDTLDRRTFLKGVTAATAFTIVPSHVLGKDKKAPSDKMNIAGVGVGGMGKSNLENMESENIVALCDVDWDHAAETFEKYPDANRYKDFRVMLEKEKDIDGVLIATPDHTHAIVTLTAMELGKHVYTQKPLTRTVSEARALTNAAKKQQLVTQMGNQGHSGEDIRLISEWIADGAIGPVREVHAWTNRPVWPQGVYKRPEPMEVPEKLAWDLFIGPSPYREYNEIYHPFKWRGWKDFGTGALGDMGCHIIDHAYTALKLRYPTKVTASKTTQFDPDEIWTRIENTETYPFSSIVTYEFPEREDMPPVKIMWYDGGLQPPRPEELEPGREMPDSGILFVGEKGKLLSGGGMTRLIPETFMQAYELPEKTIPRIEGTHEQNWIECCKELKTASSHFIYAGPLTESVLLGNIALRFPYQILKYDWKNMQFKNNEEATSLLKHDYREGWTI